MVWRFCRMYVVFWKRWFQLSTQFTKCHPIILPNVTLSSQETTRRRNYMIISATVGTFTGIGFGFAVYIEILGLIQISVGWPTWAEESLWKGLKNLSIFFWVSYHNLM